MQLTLIAVSIAHHIVYPNEPILDPQAQPPEVFTSIALTLKHNGHYGLLQACASLPITSEYNRVDLYAAVRKVFILFPHIASIYAHPLNPRTPTPITNPITNSSSTY